MSKWRVLEMFAGVAGFSVGLEKTGGFEPVGFIERDAYCQRVLSKNFPGVPIADDVTTYEFQEGEADVITAGFPCQDLSFAGDGAGLSGARSGLYREVIRAVRVVRPRRAVLENVAALLSRGLGTVLGDLAEVGYDTEWHCIPASAVGAPHRRDRIWIVANPGGEQHEGDCTPISGTLAEKLSQADLAHTERRGLEGGHVECPRQTAILASSYSRYCRGREFGKAWRTEPDVGRVAYGVSNGMDRLRALGNAVVPQVVELIGHAILQSLSAPTSSPSLIGTGATASLGDTAPVPAFSQEMR